MFTDQYKGHFIQGWTYRDECKVFIAGKGVIGTFKSYRAAQLAITREIKRGKAA